MTDCFVATFYQFASLDDHVVLRDRIEARCQALGIRGIILLATEGINATVSGTRTSVLELLDFLKSDPRFAELSWKESSSQGHPFRKLRVRLKKEIVTMGVPDVDPARLVGTYVAPKNWNALLADPDVILVDTRNDYEVEIGTFQNAVNPNIRTFRELPAWCKANINAGKQPKVAMFCTGGIRCEKSTAYLKEAGVEEVYHLEGGILKYLEDVPAEDSLWEGQCFVFDERVSVGQNLEIGDYQLCHGCRRPLSESDTLSEHYVRGVSCHRCIEETTPEQKAGFAERQRQIDALRSQG